MVGVEFCPIVGGRCNRPEFETRVQPNTFFLAEPFKPDKDRKNREDIVKIALERELEDKYYDTTLRTSDKDPREAIFCDICRMIQSSSYGVADISGLNPNVLLELGMMFALGKPVSVLFKKSDEKSLKEQLPSDIVWKRVAPYEEFVEIHEELEKQIHNRPTIPSAISPIAEVKQIIAEKDPALADRFESKLHEILKADIAEFERLMEKAKLGGAVSDQKVEIEPSVKARIEEIFRKVERLERIAEFPRAREFPKDAEKALFKGNWHYEKGEYQRAIDLYDLALNLKPDEHEAWSNKGIALDDLGRYEEAIKCYDEAIKIKPDKHETWFNKGVALGKLGRYEEAIKCYDEAIKIKPDKHTAWNNKSEVLIVTSRTAEGLKCAKEALATSKDPSQVAISLLLAGLALRLQGNAEKAEKELAKLDDHIKEVGDSVIFANFDFSPIEKVVTEKLSGNEKTKMLSLIAFLKGKRKPPQ
jgi:tetratricopeptide (TPR) repeat protein